jgi:hypothetical protein
MIDRHELLATLKPLVTELEDSIRERALSTPRIAEHLEQEHHKAIAAKRTAMSLEEWRDGEITQAAVAWILGCVFVRFLEDNGLVDQALISGPGGRRSAALGHREEYFRTHPEHSDREYLEACFHAVAAVPAVAPLYEERHNPLWRLAPTADGAHALRETFTAIDPVTAELLHDFTDPDLGTRFLGDLYQDLSESAQKRYALLQTPDFVERFILDHTLTPAIEEFGLDKVHLIDPTCGSGHFLIGAFERFFALLIDREPGSSRTVLAQRALDRIAGVDLNPYAIGIARFRLVISALRACRISRLAEAPAFTLNLATGDSLLHGPLPIDGAPLLFDANRLNRNISHVYETEDATELKRILGRGYHAVVGNPPYIAGDDSALRDAYRMRYTTCYKEFALTAPFMERFCELAVVKSEDDRQPAAGFIGKITGNAFLKREFGIPLVDQFLRSQDVTELIDTSGVHLPGHGTPTLILLARARPAQTTALKVIEGLRAEPTRPQDPAQGVVWRAIVEHHSDDTFEDSTVRVSMLARSRVFAHPVSLGPGRELREALDYLELPTVADVSEDVGYTGQTNADDLFVRPFAAWRRFGVADRFIKRFVTGTDVRHWAIRTDNAAWFPYDDSGLVSELGQVERRALWPWREVAWARRTFNKRSYKEEGRPFYEWHQVSLRRHRSSNFLVWPFVQTHTHFVPLSDRSSVFNRHAPFIKFGDEEQMHAAAGFLNSSVACAWLKQVCYDRGGGGIGGGIAEEDWERFYEFAVGRVASAPLILHKGLAEFSRRLRSLAEERSHLKLEAPDAGTQAGVSATRARVEAVESQMIALQEELDWLALAVVGLLPGDNPDEWFMSDPPGLRFGLRAFEIWSLERGLSLHEWLRRHDAVVDNGVQALWPERYAALVHRRLSALESNPLVQFVEQPVHKRRWNWRSADEDERDRLTTMVLDALEDGSLWSDLRPRSAAELTDLLRASPNLVEAVERLAEARDMDIAATVSRLVLDAAVPHLAAQRLAEKGLRKREIWERVWELQRDEDDGREIDKIPLPPKYVPADFRSGVYWKHRGKLDVPKERFVLIPNAARGADRSPVVGWSGWDERDLARALAGRIMELREQEAADAERLTPLMAGVLELLPWIHQWYSESDPLYGGPPGQYFEGWLDGQLAELGITRDVLRAWRPPVSTRGRKAKAGAA